MKLVELTIRTPRAADFSNQSLIVIAKMYHAGWFLSDRDRDRWITRNLKLNLYYPIIEPIAEVIGSNGRNYETR